MKRPGDFLLPVAGPLCPLPYARSMLWGFLKCAMEMASWGRGRRPVVMAPGRGLAFFSCGARKSQNPL
jgi:hypothetical protein